MTLLILYIFLKNLWHAHVNTVDTHHSRFKRWTFRTEHLIWRVRTLLSAGVPVSVGPRSDALSAPLCGHTSCSEICRGGAWGPPGGQLGPSWEPRSGPGAAQLLRQARLHESILQQAHPRPSHHLDFSKGLCPTVMVWDVYGAAYLQSIEFRPKWEGSQCVHR